MAAFDLRDLERRGRLIAVNDAAIYTKPRVALSLCPQWARHRAALLYTLGVPHIYLEKNCPLPPGKYAGCSTLTVFETDQDESCLSHAPGKLAGDNSGHAALNLALRMADPGDVIYLLGFDMDHDAAGPKYWYPEYPWARGEVQSGRRKFGAWRVLLAGLSEASMAGRRIEIYQVTRSASDWLAIFPALSFNDFRALAPIV